jgi:D-3-phosphoglycerate dehydrogenase
VEIEYQGDIAGFNTNPIMISYLKGLLTPILDIKVNFVNAPVLAKERGIKIKETKSTEVSEYTSLITAKVSTDTDGLAVSGSLFGQKSPRIVSIRGIDVDVAPNGCLLLMTNLDRPGVVGQVTMFLGKNNINIANMQVGRTEQGGEALTIISVDTCASADVIKQIGNFSGINKVKHVTM